MSGEPTRHFIIVFDRQAGRQTGFDEFPTLEAAVESYRERERANVENNETERFDVVLVGSDSPETVRVTHQSYFVDEGAEMRNIRGFLGDFASSRGASRLHGRTHVLAARVRHQQDELL